LNSGVGKEVKIVDVLSDTEIEAIYKYKETSKTPIELRNISMVLIGLRMGLRSSDVINLKMADIHWKESIISIVQAKTRAAITLPLPADVGNAIYAYIKYARPNVDNEIVFLRHNAPYSKLTTKICNNALYAILPKRSALYRIGLHSLRRTFSTSILRRNAGIEAVIDSLGHQDNTTVMKYLYFDEERMVKCSISLNECNISLGGEL
jgi:integrase